MGLIELASGKSVWRGMDYYNEKKVLSWDKTGDFTYDGTVSGSNGEIYDVHIDKEHQRKSTCTCPFAEGRRVIGKHMIALLFTDEPRQADDFMKQVEEYEAEAEAREKQHYIDLKKYVMGLSKAELQERLYDALCELEYYTRETW